jgi:hypothetical protein
MNVERRVASVVDVQSRMHIDGGRGPADFLWVAILGAPLIVLPTQSFACYMKMLDLIQLRFLFLSR